MAITIKHWPKRLNPFHRPKGTSRHAAITVETSPDRITLGSPGQQTPFLEIVKERNATITIIHHDKLVPHFLSTIPDPRAPIPNETTKTIDMLRASSAKLPIDPYQAVQLTCQINKLVDLETWDIACTHGSVHINQYNLIAAAREFIPDLRRHNPGALKWLLAYHARLEQVDHPGQVITLAKQSMFKNGLEPTNWKFAATLSEKLMEEATRTHTFQEAAAALNIIAARRIYPDPIALRFVMTHVIPRIEQLKRTHAGYSQLVDQNAHRLIALFLKDSTQREQDREQSNTQWYDLIDLIQHRSSLGAAIQSTTWRGALQQSQRWHREILNQVMQDFRPNNLELQNPQDPTPPWDSLIEQPVRIGTHTAIPLTSQADLNEESLALAHCVYQYTQVCRSGIARIFSIREGEKRIATTEIRFIQGEWKTTQVRGYRNSAPTKKVQRAADQIASLYNQAQNNQTQNSPKGPTGK